MRLPSGRALAALFGAYLALAIVATWPLAYEIRDGIYGLGTPPLNVWAMGAVLHGLLSDPLHLFDANAFYPYRHTLAFSEHLFVPALQAAPFAALTGNLVFAHNAVALLTLASAGLGMFLLARELVGDATAAFGAGVLYAFHSWNVNELIRLQILSNQWFPFVLWGLIRFFAGPTPRRAIGVAVACLLQALSCMYWALYLPLLCVPAIALLQARRRHAWRQLRPLVWALTAGAVLALPFAWPYVATARELGFDRPLPLSVGLERYFDVLPGNLLYSGWLGTASGNRDAAHFPGFVALAAAAYGLARGRWRADTGVSRGALLALAVTGLLLSLGPEIGYRGTRLAPGPYALLYETLAPFRHVRYPERFSLFAMLGLAPLVAAGIAALRPRLGARSGIALAGVLFLEHWSAPLPLATLPTGDRIPSAHRWLAEQEDVRVVAEVPSGRYKMERADALPMYLSTVHWKRTAQGFTGYFPPAYNFVRWRLFHFPAPESVRFCRRFGIDTVVVSPGLDIDPPRVGPSPWRSVQPFPEGHVVVRLDASREVEPATPSRLGKLSEVPREDWGVQGSSSGAGLAIDGDRETAWSTVQPQGKGDFYRIRFARPRRVARVSIAVRPPFQFPLRVRLLGDVVGEGWQERPFDDTLAYDRLFAALLDRPRHAWLELEPEPVPLRALRVRISENDAFHMPWSISEIRVFEQRETE